MSAAKSFVALVFLVSSASADDLPKNLTLQCSGNSKSMEFFPIRDKVPRWSDGVFSITIQLKDRVMTDLTNDTVLGRDCFLEKGEIGCSVTETTYNEKWNATTKAEGIVLIKRDTGSARWVHSRFGFIGKTATGKPGTTERLERTGICRVIPTPRPLF